MIPPEDPTSRAVDELNSRLVRAHRRMTAATVLVSVAAGFAGTAGILGAWDVDRFAVREAAPVFLFSMAATFAISGALCRRLLGRLRRRWIHELAGEAGVAPGEIASFALPFGGPPESVKASTDQNTYRNAAIAVGASGGVFALGFLLDWALLAELGAAAMTVIFMMTFRRYLGYRPPP